jgi:hypothetical protein
MNRINNDNVCQGSKIVFGDDNIHSSSCVMAKQMKNLSLYVGFTLRCNNYNNISKYIMGYNALTPT